MSVLRLEGYKRRRSVLRLRPRLNNVSPAATVQTTPTVSPEICHTPAVRALRNGVRMAATSGLSLVGRLERSGTPYVLLLPFPYGRQAFLLEQIVAVFSEITPFRPVSSRGIRIGQHPLYEGEGPSKWDTLRIKATDRRGRQNAWGRFPVKGILIMGDQNLIN